MDKSRMASRYSDIPFMCCGWMKFRFKLHLRPKAQSSAYVTHKIPPLPRGKSAIDVFADFLRYLHQCARTFIQETHANGVELWHTLKDRTQFVLTHPNGWEGAQQGMMRTAAIQAGLISERPESSGNLSFVTEGEASLHFCVQSGLTNEAIKVAFLCFLKNNVADSLALEWERTTHCWCWRRYHRYKRVSKDVSPEPVIRRNSCAPMYVHTFFRQSVIYSIDLNRSFPWINLCNRAGQTFSQRYFIFLSLRYWTSIFF